MGLGNLQLMLLSKVFYLLVGRRQCLGRLFLVVLDVF